MAGMEFNERLYDREPICRCCLNECRAACCLYGVWVDILEVQKIIEHADLIRPFMREGYNDPDTWFDDQEDEDEFLPGGRVRHTTVLDDKHHYGETSCIFLRPDFKCALQVAADANHLQAWTFKPFYCVLHPLDLDDEGRITLDETRLLLEEHGSCLRPDKIVHPLAEVFEPELAYLLGKERQLTILQQSLKKQ